MLNFFEQKDGLFGQPRFVLHGNLNGMPLGRLTLYSQQL